MKSYNPIVVRYSVYLSVLLLIVSLVSPTPQVLADENESTLQMIRQLAEQGDAKNQYLLGKKYLLGDGVDKNKLKGCEWSLKAAKQGHARGQNNIGLCYDYGWGKVQDLEKAAYWYGKSADQGQSHGQYNLGRMYSTGKGVKKDFEKAFSFFLAAANQGLAAAQFEVAFSYRLGEGVSENILKAAEWFQRAAEQGNVGAQYQVGLICEYGKGVKTNLETAAKWYRKAAEQGHAKAQVALGLFYISGEGVLQDYQESAKWLQKAASQGEASAQYYLGHFYEKGKGVNQDFKQAISLYHQAADQGYMNAQMSLALYYSEEGEHQDLEQAVNWFQKAAEQGDYLAQFLLGTSYETGNGVKQNLKKAIEWYRKAAEQGYVTSQRVLGVFYENGEGIPQNYHEAVEWYQKATEQGDAKSQSNLGWLYVQGKGVKKNYKKAIELFKKSAEQGYARAQANLGWMYNQGKGVKQDYEVAAEWYQKAAAQDFAMAYYNLGLLYLDGHGVQKSSEQAAMLFQKAADHGLALAQKNLASLYSLGDGVTQDFAKAFTYYKSAAEQNNARAQNSLGKMYLKGKGVRSDRVIAKQWFQKAAAQGDKKAKRNLQQLERLKKVFLVINKNGHAGFVKELIFSSDGKLLISASSDKTIDVWDVDSGKNLRTITGEIGPGDDGRFTTIALSPKDNTLLAVGGDFPGSKGDIRIYDIITGDLKRVLSGHTLTISDLHFSSDGKHLLSCGYDGTARIWEVATGKLLTTLNHAHSIRRGIFLKHNDIVVTAAGQNLYWWNIRSGKTIQEIRAHDGGIRSLVSLPNGNIVSSGSDYMVKEWNSQTGSKISEFKAGQPLTEMSIPTDGNLLFWSRQDRFGTLPLKKGGTEFFIDREKKSRFISASSIAPDGNNAAVGYADGKIYFVNIDEKKIVKELSSPVTRIKKVNFASDGTSLVWHQQGKTYGLQLKNDKGFYKLGNVVKELHDPTTLTSEKTEVNDWSITLANKENNLLEIRKKGKVLHTIDAANTGGFKSFHDSQITPDGKTLLTYNGGYIISAYDMASGKWLWQRPFDAATGMIDDIAISPDSRFLVTGETDQTIKLYEIETGNLLLTLYFDGEKEWIAWNPDGYYTGSLGGDQLISWHLNQGPDKAALRFPARQFSKQFYSPDQIVATLSGKEQQAIAIQKIHPTKKKQSKSIEELIPPVVSFVVPTDSALTITSQKLRIRGKAVSKNSEPITDIWVLVNGRRAETARRVMPSKTSMKKLDGLSAEIDVTVNIPDEHTIISLIASNRYSQSAPLMFEVNKPDNSLQVQLDTAWNDKSKAKKPNLYILAVGVSDYEQRDISLNFAHNDAEGVAEAFSGQEGKLYEKVYERVLTNEKATRDNILDGLDWLMNKATQEDITVLFIAGHGQKDQSGNYYFLPYDIDINALRKSGLRWNEFNDVLYKLPSKIILMADTCHSGSITGKTQGSNISNVLREIVGSEGGIVVLTASTGDEVSVERSDWGHGAFSKAVIEGLKGEAEGRPIDNKIDILELASYINKRVKILTAGRQHATTEIPRVLPTFDLIAL